MKTVLFLILSMSLVIVSCGSKKDSKKESTTAAETASTQGTQPQLMSQADMQGLTQDWPEPSKKLVQQMVSKYGQPYEGSNGMLTWRNNGPWTKTVVYKDHGANSLEQTANIEVPPEKMGDLALFNKAISIDRESNEVTAKSDREEMNFLAMNLSKDIIDGKMSAIEARRQYSSLTDVMERSNYTEGLNFGSRAPSNNNNL